MNLLKVFIESFEFLKKYPKFFLPKLVSVTIWNIFYVFLFETITSLKLSTYASQVSGSLGPILVMLLVFSPISVIVYSMYPNLVKSYKKNNSFSFYKSFIIAIEKFPKAMVVFATPIIITVMLITPFVSLALIGYSIGNEVFILVGAIPGIVITIIFTILFYFAPSSIIIRDIGIIESLEESWTLGRKNFKEVSMITLFSFGLLLSGYIFSGSLKTAGIIGFLFGRYIQAVFGTYLTVLNPDLYLGISDKNES